jgi:uncharacterized protein YbaR (Trm112 family)
VSLDSLLIEVLACPVDKGPLWWIEDDQVLYNPRLHQVYAESDGIPDMLVDDARPATEAEQERWSALHAKGGVVETGTAGR